MKIENVAKIKVDEKQGSVMIVLEQHDGEESLQIHLLMKNMRINIEDSRTIEVFIDARKWKCKECDGKGSYFITDHNTFDAQGEEVPCGACGGKGKIM